MQPPDVQKAKNPASDLHQPSPKAIRATQSPHGAALRLSSADGKSRSSDQQLKETLPICPGTQKDLDWFHGSVQRRSHHPVVGRSYSTMLRLPYSLRLLLFGFIYRRASTTVHILVSAADGPRYLADLPSAQHAELASNPGETRVTAMPCGADIRPVRKCQDRSLSGRAARLKGEQTMARPHHPVRALLPILVLVPGGSSPRLA